MAYNNAVGTFDVHLTHMTSVDIINIIFKTDENCGTATSIFE